MLARFTHDYMLESDFDINWIRCTQMYLHYEICSKCTASAFRVDRSFDISQNMRIHISIDKQVLIYYIIRISDNGSILKFRLAFRRHLTYDKLAGAIAA